MAGLSVYQRIKYAIESFSKGCPLSLRKDVLEYILGDQEKLCMLPDQVFHAVFAVSDIIVSENL